jgi:hypothetical protein
VGSSGFTPAIILAISVLTRDVEVRGFGTESWIRWGRLLRGPTFATGAERRLGGGIVALTTGDRLRKLISTRSGRLDCVRQSWPVSLEQLAAEHRARWSLSLEVGAPEALMDRLAARIRPEQEYLEQLLELLGVLRELNAEGMAQTWPRGLNAWVVPTPRVARRALDAICPEGKVVVFGVFAGGELWTALAARRRASGFDCILGPEELRPEMGLLSGDWTRDYRHLARAAEGKLGELALGCFGERDTVARLVRRAVPGDWSLAVAARDIILAPAGPAVAIPLGLDMGRAALLGLRELTERLGVGSLFRADGPLAPAVDRLKELSLGDSNLPRLLGFDPFELIRRLLSRDDG